jgi:hypothetical protein
METDGRKRRRKKILIFSFWVFSGLHRTADIGLNKETFAEVVQERPGSTAYVLAMRDTSGEPDVSAG